MYPFLLIFFLASPVYILDLLQNVQNVKEQNLKKYIMKCGTFKSYFISYSFLLANLFSLLQCRCIHLMLDELSWYQVVFIFS